MLGWFKKKKDKTKQSDQKTGDDSSAVENAPANKPLSSGLSKTRENLVQRMDLAFLSKKQIDSELLDELEEILITADLGVKTTMDLLEHARSTIKRKKLNDPQVLKDVIKEKIRSYITDANDNTLLKLPESGPFIIMVVGVNGVGKTTTIGKIARKFIKANHSVMLVAADTFRAAAAQQLSIWGERNNVKVVTRPEGTDPSSVVFDGIDQALGQNYDIVLIDTAGRLHTQKNLMEELKKIKRIISRKIEGAPHEVMLVLDATTGQNALSQAKLFNEVVDITGITLTKLDGTAKGGIVINISRELKIPLRFIGIGEQVDDLRDFEGSKFTEALFDSYKGQTEEVQQAS